MCVTICGIFCPEEGTVAGYAEAFRPVQSDSQTSEWYSYFENDVLVFIDGWLGGNGGENEKMWFYSKKCLHFIFCCDNI